MARIIVIADISRRPSIDEHASRQIIERVAWAVLDAQEVTNAWSR